MPKYMFQKFVNYIKETKGELKKVNWLSRKDTINFTIIVIAVSVGMAVLLGAFDFIFNKIISILI